MKFSELAVLLPCHSLEDFPVYHEGSEADELLAAWCAPWHPALLASTGNLPTWHRIDSPPDELAGRLLIVPPFCADRLPAGYAARATNEGALLVRERTRAAAVAKALGALDGGDQGISATLAADFLALGFCRLQIELLTRQMRYSMYIDETHFANEANAAAQAAMAHDEPAAREHLAQCFDTLNEARKHFYPVDVYLLDITLLTPETLGEPLVQTLTGGTPTNLLASPGTLQAMAAKNETWQALLGAIDAGCACVLGTDGEDREWPVLPLEQARQSVRNGVDEYERLLGRRPVVYGRRRAGLWPALPQLLTKCGYTGALHFTLDDGQFPLGPQAKTRWEGMDTSVIDVFDRVPYDITKPQTFLALSRHLADTMDSDHVATLAVAHWPGASSVWYDDLRRIAELSPVLGKFMLLDDYFSHTDMPGRLSKFTADEYRTPYLKQAVIRRQADPISSIASAHRERAAQAAAEAIGLMADQAGGTSDASSTKPGVAASLERLQSHLPRSSGSPGKHTLVVNPLSFARQIAVEMPGATPAESQDAPRVALVDVPGMGFAWLDAAAPALRRGKPVAHDNALTNDLFEATISPKTGGIQSLFHFGQRGNQLSQQLALRSGGREGTYSTMQAEELRIVQSSPTFGQIASRGVLLNEQGQRVAGFRQTFGMHADSRVLQIDIELEVDEEPRADPWNSYYAIRFAWPLDDTELWRGVALGRQKTNLGRFEAPEYVDLDTGSSVLSILTGGLPYHRRSDARMLDTLLVVRGETARKFRVGVGVDLPHPAAAAAELLAPPTTLQVSGPAPAAGSGWFLHVGGKNLIATSWQPLPAESPESANVAAAPRGFRARLLETAGQSGRTSLRAFRGLAAARQVDFLGQTLLTLPVDGDKITLDYGAFEWIEIEALWSDV